MPCFDHQKSQKRKVTLGNLLGFQTGCKSLTGRSLASAESIEIDGAGALKFFILQIRIFGLWKFFFFFFTGFPFVAKCLCVMSRVPSHTKAIAILDSYLENVIGAILRIVLY